MSCLCANVSFDFCVVGVSCFRCVCSACAYVLFVVSVFICVCSVCDFVVFLSANCCVVLLVVCSSWFDFLVLVNFMCLLLFALCLLFVIICCLLLF